MNRKPTMQHESSKATHRRKCRKLQKTTKLTLRTREQVCLTGRNRKRVRVRAESLKEVLLSSSPIPWCNTGALTGCWRDFHLQKESDNTWTRRHTTDAHLYGSDHPERLTNALVSFRVRYVAAFNHKSNKLPVLDVRILELTGLHRRSVHLHPICRQQQTHSHRSPNKSDNTINKILSKQLLCLIFLQISVTQ